MHVPPTGERVDVILSSRPQVLAAKDDTATVTMCPIYSSTCRPILSMHVLLPTFQVRASAVCAEPLCRARIVSPTQQGRDPGSRLTGWGSAVGSLKTVGRRREQRLAFRKLRGRVRLSRMCLRNTRPHRQQRTLVPRSVHGPR